MGRQPSLAMVLLGVLLTAGPSCDRGKQGGPGDQQATPHVSETPRQGVVEVKPEDTSQAVIGQTIYVPTYSHIAIANDARPFNLAVTLSVRNTDRDGSIVVSSVRYFSRDGQLIRDYLKAPVRLAPMASTGFFVKESDTQGGPSTSFLVDWTAERTVSDPVVEAVMVGTASTQGVSFTCSGRVVARRGR